MDGRSIEWTWYARADAEAHDALRGLRVETDLEWARSGGALWFRGRGPAAPHAAGLARGGAALYRPVAGDALVRAHPAGLAVPTERVPDADWRPAAELVEVAVQPPALAGTPGPLPALGVVRGGAPRPASGLRLPLADLVDWARDAAQARLEALVFAADASGETFVVGTPLPPVGGELFWEENGVFVPAGFRLEPQVTGDVARAALVAAYARSDAGAGDGDRYVVDPRGASRLRSDAFLPASRSALRATLVGVSTP